MRRLFARVLVVAMMLLGVGVAPAMADVHGVSQANCAPSGVRSGASAQASRDAVGRPDAPIPVKASGERTQGRGGAADAQGQHC